MEEPYRNCMWTAAGYDCMGNKDQIGVHSLIL